MAEILDGVLSEALLNELAEDLGISPTTLRENPVFRVLKGRVLLTYPLKVLPRYAYNYSIYIDADYDIGDTYTIPEGEELVWLMSDFGIANCIEMYDGAAWNDIEVAEGVKPDLLADAPLVLANPLYSFGGLEIGSVRIATSANDNKLLQVCTRTWAEQ